MQIWLCEVEWFQNSEMRTLPKPGKPYGILIIFPAKRDVSITRYAKSFDSVKKVMRFENILTLVKNQPTVWRTLMRTLTKICFY